MDIIYSIFNQLGVNNTFFVMMIFFIIAYTVCYFLGFKHLAKILYEREVRINGRNKKIKGLTEEYSNISSEWNEKVNSANKEASTELGNLKLEAINEQKQILNEARAKASAEIKQAKKIVDEKIKKEYELIQKDVPQIVSLIVSKFTNFQNSKLNKSTSGSSVRGQF